MAVLNRDRRPFIRFLLSRPLPPETAFAFQGQFRILDENRNPSTRGLVPDLLALDCAAATRADPAMMSLSRAIAILGPFSAEGPVSDSGGPWFLVLGERSRADVAAAEALRDRLKDGRLIRFPDLGSLAHIEEPELIARVLRLELEELPSPGKEWFRRA